MAEFLLAAGRLGRKVALRVFGKHGVAKTAGTIVATGLRLFRAPAVATGTGVLGVLAGGALGVLGGLIARRYLKKLIK